MQFLRTQAGSYIAANAISALSPDGSLGPPYPYYSALTIDGRKYQVDLAEVLRFIKACDSEHNAAKAAA